ncbi:MAG: PD40 domain-containing protein [Acidobacteria bacterium]|nr:PD40 domain-containing protein [Acidobacteriota bacterium]
MEESSSSPTPSARSDDRLDSWKEIAAYFNRDVSTVQRWEKLEGMPIQRHLHRRMGSVYAYRADLEAWAHNRNPGPVEVEANQIQANSPSLIPSRPGQISSLYGWGLALVLIAALAVTIATFLGMRLRDSFWPNPISQARFQTVTDFDDGEQAATISRDGQFVAFLSNRDGPTDLWITQVGSGEFHNLTRGSAPEVANPFVRNLGFSPDGSLVTFWGRKDQSSGGISIWAVPTLGGQPRPYLEGVAESDWSQDGSYLAYHTPSPGDPLFVSDGRRQSPGPPIFTAPAGLHSHFPLWSPDSRFIYFVEGSLPDNMDIWRIRPYGGAPQRITSQNARLTHPVLLDPRTLMYLASDPDGSGPWLYGVDVDRRVPHRLSSGVDRYTSLAASADGHRLVVTLASPKRTLWRLPMADLAKKISKPVEISLTTGSGFFPRLGPNYLLYVSRARESDSIWKLANGISSELWSGQQDRLLGGPAISPDGQKLAFSVEQHGQTLLYTLALDGSNAKVISESLALEGAPTWTPDGQSITVAANDHGTPHLFRVPVDDRAPELFLREYSLDPVWVPDGGFVVYSGPDIGTTFSIKAAPAEAAQKSLASLSLTRGARHLAFLPGKKALVFLRGEIRHKNLWLIDLDSGAEQQLTNLNPDFEITDFDISPDGHELVVERLQERSDIVLLDLPRRKGIWP